MIFYEIELLSPIRIHHAMSVTHTNYHVDIRDRTRFLELAVIREGRARYEYPDGSEETVSPAMFCSFFTDTKCIMESVDGEIQRNDSIWLTADYIHRRRDTQDSPDYLSLKDRVRLGDVILIPYRTPLGEKYELILQLYSKIISLTHSPNPSDRPRALGAVYALMAMLTDIVISSLDKTHISLPPSALHYASDAKAYIAQNYAKPLRVEDIALHLGISAGYLHSLFKEVTSLSLMDFVNRYRVEQACSLITNTSLTLREISEMVGIPDPAYMSRLFKKITGVSFTEYKKQEGHSLLLYTSCT